MKKKFHIIKPDVKNDKLLWQNEVSVESKQNTVNFLPWMSLTSKHLVKEYEKTEGEFQGKRYYVFKNIQGQYVQNYIVPEYKELSRKIELNDDIAIFWEDDDGTLMYVSTEYRHHDDANGMGIYKLFE